MTGAASAAPLAQVMLDECFCWQPPRGSAITLPYRLYVPERAKSGEALPLLLYLHGAGERGDDNLAQITAHSQLLAHVRALDNCILLAPQCPLDAQWVSVPWSLGSYDCKSYAPSVYLQAVHALVLSLAASIADPARLYAAGISMGGYGVWRLLMDDPALFAAAIPICGGADPGRASTLARLPIWTFHGSGDPTVPVSGTREMAQAIRACGGMQLRYTEYPGVGHESWLLAFEEPELLSWLFSHKK